MSLKMEVSLSDGASKDVFSLMGQEGLQCAQLPYSLPDT